MPSGNNVKSGGAWVEIFADDSPLRRALKAATVRLQAFAAPVVSVGKSIATGFAGASVALAGITKVFANFGDQVADISGRTGLGAKAVSELGYAAKMSGSSMESLEAAVRTMQKGLGSGASADVLQQLGLDPAQLKASNPEQQFLAIAEAISKVSDPTQQAALAMKVFGKAGTEMLPLINEGSAGIEALRQEARDLGVSLSDEQAGKAAAFNDALDKIQTALMGIAVSIGSAVAPLLTWLAEAVAKQAARFGEWLAAVLEFVGSYENAMATLKLAWVSVTTTLEGFWDTVITNLVPPFVAAIQYIAGAWDTTVTNMQIVFANVTAAIQTTAITMVGRIASAFDDLVTFLGGAATGLGLAFPQLAEQMEQVANFAKQAHLASKGITAAVDATAGAAERNRADTVAGLTAGLEQRRATRSDIIAGSDDSAGLEARRAARQAAVDAAAAELAATMQATRDAATEAAKQSDAQAAAEAAGMGSSESASAAETAGTFNVAAIFGMGAGSVQTDILKATERVARGIEALSDNVAAGGLT